MCWLGGQHLLFAIDQISGVQGGDFKAVAVGDGVSWAGLYAITAKDAAVVVNVIDLGVALGAADAVLRRVFRGLNVNAVRRTGSGTEKTGHALFQTILIALQDVDAAKALLKLRALERSFAIGIVLHHGGGEHLAEGDGHALGDAGDVFNHGHEFSVSSER